MFSAFLRAFFRASLRASVTHLAHRSGCSCQAFNKASASDSENPDSKHIAIVGRGGQPSHGWGGLRRQGRQPINTINRQTRYRHGVRCEPKDSVNSSVKRRRVNGLLRALTLTRPMHVNHAGFPAHLLGHVFRRLAEPQQTVDFSPYS